MSKQISIKPIRVTREDINIINALINEDNANSLKRLMADSYYQGKGAGVIEGAIVATAGAIFVYVIENVIKPKIVAKKKKVWEDELANLINDLDENNES